MRYLLATADDLSTSELNAWKRIIPRQVWEPSAPWLGPNDAVIQLRVFDGYYTPRMLVQNESRHIGRPCPNDPSTLFYYSQKNKRTGELLVNEGTGTQAPCTEKNSALVSKFCWARLGGMEGMQKLQGLCTWDSSSIPRHKIVDGTCDKHLFAPPIEFYERLFAERRAREEARKGAPNPPGSLGGWDNVWLVVDPKAKSELISQLLKLGVKRPPKPSTSDMALGAVLYDLWTVKKARFVVESYGTFSWMGGFLSRAEEVHKPYTSSNWAAFWSSETSLFVDDQPTYWYHNAEYPVGRTWLSAAQVLEVEPPTSAFRMALERRPGLPDEVAKGRYSLKADPSSCAAANGIWTDCPRVPASDGNNPANALCTLNGRVVFSRPCHRPCFEAQ